MKIIALSRLTHGDKTIQPGESIVLDAAKAQILIDLGVAQEDKTKPADPAAETKGSD